MVRRIIIVLFIVLSLFLVGVEYFHRREFGHFVSYGLHVDVLNREADIGIPGQTHMYWPRLSNYTFWPTSLMACDYVSDAMTPSTEYPYAVQRWNSSTNQWDTIVESNGPDYCRPYPLGMSQTKLVSKRLWPAMSVDVMEGEATGAREPFQKGDRARFIVFTTIDKQRAWQSAIPSAPFVIQDQVVRGEGSFRVKH